MNNLQPERSRAKQMMGRVGSSRDSSFLCLLAIYAAHVLLFHVLAVAPHMGKQVAASRAAFFGFAATTGLELHQPATSPPDNTNSSQVTFAPEPPPPDYSPATGDALLSTAQQLHHQIFVRSSSARLWENSMTNLMSNYPKIHVDFSLLFHYFQRIKSVFTTAAWSSSTWGIISGCAIFLLTYTERDHAH